jgi:hypothetical protein
MLTCLALVAFNAASLADIPRMTDDLEADARALAAETLLTPALVDRVEAFSSEAELLSSALQNAGVGQDMPCVFRGIAKDARERASELAAADTQSERNAAFMNLRVLMGDALTIAPLAAAAAADRAAERDIALR